MAAGRLRRDALLVAGSRIAASLSVLAAEAVLTRTFSIATFGDYQQLRLVLMLYPVFALGLPQSLLYFLPRLGAAERTAPLVNVLVSMALGGLGFGAAVHVLAPQVAAGFANPEIIEPLHAFAPFAFATVATGFTDALLVAVGRTRLQAGISLAHGAALFAAITLPALAGASLTELCTVLSAYGIVRWLATLVLAITIVGWPPGPLRSGFLKRQLRYSLPLGLSESVGLLSRAVDKVAVKMVFPSSVFALYSIGARELPMVGILLGAIGSVLTPEIARLDAAGDRAAILATWHRAVVGTAALVWPICTVLWAFAEPVMVTVFGADYAPAAIPFRIYLGALPLRVAAYGALLSALGCPGAVFWAALGDLFVNAAASFTLAHAGFFLGPAYATVGTTYLHVAVLLIVARRTLGVSFGELIPWASLGRIGLAALAASALAATTWALPLPPQVRLLIAFPLALGGYIAAGRALAIPLVFAPREIVGVRPDVPPATGRRDAV